MADPNSPNRTVHDLTEFQYANPFGSRDDELGYEIEQFHCIYLGNNRFWCAETKQEMRMRDNFTSLFEGVSIGSDFVWEIKTKPGTQITSVKFHQIP